MLNKKILLPLLAFAGALFVIYSIAQASDPESPASDTPAVEEGHNPCHPDKPKKPKNPCHPEHPEHPNNPCHPQNPCHHSTGAPLQDNDHNEEDPTK